MPGKSSRHFQTSNSRLLAAIEQYPDVATGRLNVLQRQVIAEAMHHARMNDWADAVPARTANERQRTNPGPDGSFRSVRDHWHAGNAGDFKSATALSKPNLSAAAVPGEMPVTVEQGNAELERGTSLLVLARFTGKPPADVHVIWRGADERPDIVCR